MIEMFAELIPTELMQRSGVVFYSGRVSFAKPTPMYILGYNPGSDDNNSDEPTIALETNKLLQTYPDRFSSYIDADWGSARRMQKSMRCMFEQLKVDPQETPSSNLIFARSRSEVEMRDEADALEALCWPFHEAVIRELQIEVVLSLGKVTGEAVQRRIEAWQPIGQFCEKNNRGWKSEAFKNNRGLTMVSVTHPSRAAWSNPSANPAPLIRAVMNGDHSFANS